MANAWLTHVKSTMKKYPKMKFKEVLKKAKHTYKKSASSSSSSSCVKKCAKKARKTRKRGASKKRRGRK